MTTITLKDILTNDNLKAFFKHHFKFFLNFPKSFLHFIKSTLVAAQNCREFAFAKSVFSCPTCSHYTFRPVTCKSKFCSSCGKIYAEKWAHKLSSQLIDKKHKHMIFTLPKEIWNYPIIKRDLLATFSEHIKTLFKAWFKKYDIENFGLIVAIHTFSRDSSFHPHFHVILSLGGFKKNLTWKSLEFFPPKFFNNSWRYLVLKSIANAYPKCKKTKEIISLCYKKDFFINLKGETLDNEVSALKYIGRYLMRPAIAEYRITKFENNQVTFWYIDVATKEKIFLTLPLFKFIGRLILHINPKGFKAIRRYGFYARNIKTNLKSHIRCFFKKKISAIIPLTWRERIFKIYGKDPLICPNCFTEMKLTSFHHKKYGDLYYS
ncbi:transposase [Psychrilyobacter sp. S5]|nr:transposase [Psychrilyobacter sp. S5]MCS5421440.1 transposase [Psychrilyobacter sp. S5]MCS5422059.1 transposase [Psychrilyobacter sp. S5]